MEDKVRNLLFQPLVRETLSAIVPDFIVELSGKQIVAPARLTSEDGDFTFTLHFMDSRPPAGLGRLEKKVLTKDDQLKVRGQIEGEIAFQCNDVFPPAGSTGRSRGTSTITVSSSRMDLTPEGDDTLTASQLRALVGLPPQPTEGQVAGFHAHLIFHGPELRMPNAGTERRTKNDFLGEAAGSSMDTQVFSGTDYEGALIQKDEELHLHIRSKEHSSFEKANAIDLVDRVMRAAAFVGGFHPWPAYREIRVDHPVIERWISPRLNLKQTYLAPVSGSLWSSFRLDTLNPLHAIIPTITDGLGALPKAKQDRLETLIWHVRSSALSDLPGTTKMLILCAALEGLVKLVADHAPKSKMAAHKIWKNASNTLGINWQKWTEGIFGLWKRHRNSLAHGWLWTLEESDDVGDYFADYPRLGCAFMTLVAAWCGYEGPISADPFELRATVIGSIK